VIAAYSFDSKAGLIGSEADVTSACQLGPSNGHFSTFCSIYIFLQLCRERMANAQEESLRTTEVRKLAQASPPTTEEKFQIAKRAVIRVGYGRGFIVSAGESRYVITAVHCLPRYRIPRPHLANSVPELTFRNALGPLASKQRTIWAELCAISLTDDFAAFSEPDAQVLNEQHEQYEKFTEPAMTIGKPPEVVEPNEWRITPGMAAWVLSLDCEWQPCTVHNGGRFLSIKLEGGIKRGMFGSPIIDANGAAIGLISTSGDELSWNPSLMDCLPPWLLRKLDSV
jgi:hypothetical protein